MRPLRLSRARMLLAAALIGTALLPASAQTAHAQPYAAMDCDQLWYARNAIYANKGYCFKTARAQAVFGTRCYPPYGKLNANEQRRVNRIRDWEQRKSCGVSGGGSGIAPGGGYAAMTCDQLWYERNAIYANKGYCFKTARAKAVFGNRCYPPYGKLNGAEQRRVNRIQSWESRKGCR